jgi:hypothetical protein
MKPRQSRRPKARAHLFDELGPISDETAAVIGKLLWDMHVQFEERFLGEILRHHQSTRPSPKNPVQPSLPGLSDSEDPF